MIIVLRPNSTDRTDRPHPRAHPGAGLQAAPQPGRAAHHHRRHRRREQAAGRAAAAIPGVEQVLPILKPFKLASREFHKEDTVVAGRQGQDRRRLAGHDRRAVRRRERARCSTRSPARSRRPGRTSSAAGRSSRAPALTASRAWARRGCKILRDVGDKYDMPVVTEVMDPRQVELVETLRRHVPDRRPQHAELRPAQGGRPDAASRCCSSAA